MSSAKLKGPLPLFALPDLVVFPGFPQPLHIFEVRYVRMVEDLLDSDGFLVIGTVLGDDRDLLQADAPVQNIGSLGVVEQYEKREAGRFNIVFRGLARARLHAAPSAEVYRRVLVEIADDTFRPRDEEVEYKERIRDALSQLGPRVDRGEVSLFDKMSLSQLADLLLFQLQLPPEKRYGIYSRLSVRERVEAALATYGERGEQ